MKLPRRTILNIAHEAQCDERTVRRALRTRKPKYVSEQRDRIRNALRHMGLDNLADTV